IAVDGPAASGKSSVARLVAERALGRSPADGYLDTGAMYRAVTWAVLRAEVDPADAERVAGIAEKVSLEITDHGDAALQEVLLDGSDVAEAIRSPEVDEAVSVVAANARVRETMVARQRAWAAEHVPAVVDGRDIGSVVLPDAVLKIFLTASPEVRARRRAGQRTAGSVTERDERDSTRTESPLTVAGNAVIVDTSEMKIEEVVGEIAQLYEQAREQAGMTEPGPA
ncbi:MAG TPA: (d)CMP kinase, partial [Acidimicrobiaceae bacterium]|nr:(d)CMP kinase [Acidimicrobiaceae bacterium]